jgi:hypothetical protein
MTHRIRTDKEIIPGYAAWEIHLMMKKALSN